MKIRYSEHALARIYDRSIPRSYIRLAISAPDTVTPTLPPSRGRSIYHKAINENTLEVVAVREGDIMTVITAYYVERES